MELNLDNAGSTLTIDHMLANDNILADRFGMAAISYIFKAFGDDVRSKEYWPWSEKSNCMWPGVRGIDPDNKDYYINKTITILYHILSTDVEIGTDDSTYTSLTELKTNVGQVLLSLNELYTDICKLYNAGKELSDEEIEKINVKRKELRNLVNTNLSKNIKLKHKLGSDADASIINLRKRLSTTSFNIDSLDNITDKINETSTDVEKEINRNNEFFANELENE